MLVANESIEDIKRKKKSYVYLKVNYEKAYDLVRWDFVYYMLGILGFYKSGLVGLKIS